MKQISKKGKITLISIASVIVILAIIIASINIHFSVLGGKIQVGEAVGYAWSETDSFDTQKSHKLDMGESDYKVLVLTDIHLKNHGTFAKELGINYLLDGVSDIAIDKLVKKTNPDLILVLGDSVLTDRNDIEYERFVKNMDSYKRPWACVFGNHDDEGRADKAKLVDVLKTSEYGLFEYGPNDLHGAGNYLIELQRNGNTQQAMFMLDSGSSLEFPEKTEGINEKQIKWYEWNMQALAENNGGVAPKNMAFFHIPLPQYSSLDNFEQGDRGEDSCPQNGSGDFFDSMKKFNGTHIFVGHDHSNNFITTYDGIKLAYATKSSYNCYFKSGMTGGTLLTIDTQNNVKEEIILF